MKALILSIVLIYSGMLDLSYGTPSGVLQPFRTPAQAVIDSVASEDRAMFVIYHISIALDARRRTDVYFIPFLEQISWDKLQEFKNVSVPFDFSGNLLDWTEFELVPIKNRQVRDGFGVGISDETILLCFPSGCVDPNDAGELCCPF